ncbi:Hypothetical predicted protein [Cloeon dipterum]|uniref:Uncharacterized protein n=1 Tax=Cloeon dipterum TaxID=197152 RepID=A0A8S1D1A2_9INSE|nr:Hypothetical predicted protein [Cloeon dipterum]
MEKGRVLFPSALKYRGLLPSRNDDVKSHISGGTPGPLSKKSGSEAGATPHLAISLSRRSIGSFFILKSA